MGGDAGKRRRNDVLEGVNLIPEPEIASSGICRSPHPHPGCSKAAGVLRV